MNNISYLHYSKDKKSLISRYFLALLPLILFSFYKNGFLLYQNEFISFADVFIPFYFYLISGVIGYLVALISKEEKSEMVLASLILACSVSINTNMIIYPFLLFASLFIACCIQKKYELNGISLVRILLLLSLFANGYSYLNVVEKIGAFDYNLFDLFLGFGSGGIGSNSLLLVLIAFLILCFNPFYKRWIPIMASISFLIILFVLFFLTKDVTYMESLLNGSVYFGFVFVGADLRVSPNTKKGMMFYGLVIGILCGILAIFVPIFEVSFLSILIVSLFIPVINRFFLKKDLHF